MTRILVKSTFSARTASCGRPPSRRCRTGMASSSGESSLLYGEQKSNLVAQFTVDLIRDEGSGFRPGPSFLGLTALDEGEESFHQAMQRSWRLSGVEKLGYRGRWWITGFRPPDTGFTPPLS